MAEVFSPGSLIGFTQRIAQAVGFSAEHGRILGESLVEAELRGIESHGLIHLRMYLVWTREGLINTRPSVRTVRDAGPTVLLDGDFGLGQILGQAAMDLAISQAAQHGVGVVGVRNSNSFGAAGHYPLRAVERAMVGFSLQNTAPHIVPPGGIAPLVGNSPFAIAIPTGEIPILLDIACSSVARATLIMAAKRGERIPLGWAVDRAGRPTDDPAEALAGGLLPFGGHKGYGLALVLGLLGSTLLGADYDEVLETLYFPRPKGFGLLMAAVNVAHFQPVEAFYHAVGKWLHRIRTAPVAAGVDRLYVPGERSHNLQARRLHEGLPLSPTVIEDLRNLGAEFGVPFPDGQELGPAASSAHDPSTS